MATGDFGLLGGATFVGGTATSALSQVMAQANSANAMNQNYTLTYNPYLAANQFMITSTTTDTVGIGASLGPVKEKAAPWKTAKRAIDRLRMEIDDWHGDVLNRCAA